MIGFLAGELGDPPGGWPEPFRTKALQGRDPEAADVDLSPRTRPRRWRGATARPTLNRLLFPGPTKEFTAARETYGDVSVLPTRWTTSTGCGRGDEHDGPDRPRASA